ncbi:MAG: glycosyltransferase [Desulfovibrionaceae bacterium]|nr:glycosyltransferase [Desulfovibrionaceae bacterium]
MEFAMKQNLRVLLVLPMYGGSLPIGRFCAQALESIGAGVRVFEAPVFYPTFTGLRSLDLAPEHITSLERSFLQVVGQAIFAHVQTYEPHLVLAMAQAPLSKQILNRLQRLGIRTAMWFVEDYALFTYWKYYAPLYDVFCVIQKEPFLTELAAIGQKHALYLPLAADPGIHKKVSLSPQEKQYYGADIGFLGAGYPNRRLAFRPLAGKNFKIWGSDWDNEQILAKNIQKNGQRIELEESIKIYQATTVNLNLHSSVHVDTLISHGDFVNPRTFELACMGAFQLVDTRSLMPELFAQDTIASFDTMEEFYEKIEFFLHHPEERASFCAKAQATVIQKHTYAHRMKTLLAAIEKDLGWPSFAKDQSPQADKPYEKDLQNLLASLHAGPNATFKDVIARLRKQSGKLTETEVSLLFLDEWHKQYFPDA